MAQDCPEASLDKEFGVRQIKRDELPEGRHLCEFCTAKCCNYIAVPYETPTDFDDMEYIRWVVLHKRATVFREGEDWYVLVHTPCEHLGDDHKCGIYHTRPQICRDYTTDNCEYDNDWTYDFYLETADQVWEYTEAVYQEKGKTIRSPKPDPLTVLA